MTAPVQTSNSFPENRYLTVRCPNRPEVVADLVICYGEIPLHRDNPKVKKYIFIGSVPHDGVEVTLIFENRAFDNQG